MIDESNQVATAAAIEAHRARVARGLVPDQATAMKIALAVLGAYTSEEYVQGLPEKYEPHVQDDADVWTIFWSLKGRPVFGGGGPCVQIAKKDGQVRNLYFMR